MYVKDRIKAKLTTN